MCNLTKSFKVHILFARQPTLTFIMFFSASIILDITSLKLAFFVKHLHASRDKSLTSHVLQYCFLLLIRPDGFSDNFHNLTVARRFTCVRQKILQMSRAVVSRPTKSLRLNGLTANPFVSHLQPIPSSLMVSTFQNMGRYSACRSYLT